eukprot:6720121-Pyramimonas_sp.AAC.1
MTGAKGLRHAHAAPPRARGHDANFGRGSLAKPYHITANMRTDVSFHARDLTLVKLALDQRPGQEIVELGHVWSELQWVRGAADG